MKHLKILFLLLLAVIGAQTVSAHDFEVDGIYYNKNGTNVTVTYQGGSLHENTHVYIGSVYIPSTVTYKGTTYSVTSIGDYAFLSCTGLSSVTIPNSVRTIGGSAFEGCTGLTSVTIGNSVTSIGSDAFEGCSRLTSVTIPNSVTTIGREAFRDCIRLTSVTIGNSVTSIGEMVFYGCWNLASVIFNAKHCSFTGTNSPFIGSGIKTFTFGNDVKVIPSYICKGLIRLTSVIIGNSVDKIYSKSFMGCTGLTSVIWNANNCVNFGDNSPFADLTGIKTFTFGNDVMAIPSCMCEGLTGLTSVTIGNSVTTIGSKAFKDCLHLTSVTIPNSVTSIGSNAFSCCSGLTSVTIPNSVTTIGSQAFYPCSGLTSVTWYARSCEDFSSYSPPFFGGNIQNFTFGEEVERIPAHLCERMYGLTSVTIPSSVTSIGSSAFSGCSGLTSVTIPNSVTSIGNYAFYGCSSLTSVTIGNSVTSIGNSAFYRCSGLISVTIGNSVTSIGDKAFMGCFVRENTNTIYSLNPTPPSIKEDTFFTGSIDNETYSGFDATLFVPIGSKTIYQTTEGWKKFKNIVEKEYDGIDNVVIDQPINPLENPDEIKIIYTIDGCKLNPQDVSRLPNGIYIVNGKKILINR